MQEHLDERDGKYVWIFIFFHWVHRGLICNLFFLIEAELLKRNSEDIMENLHMPKNTVVLLKKELAQKTEALNKALKRESELKVS